MKKTGPTNPELVKTIQELKKVSIEKKLALWKRITTEQEKTTKNRRVVNLSKITRHTKEGEIIIVPGKLLAGGELGHKVKIVAWTFSKQAEEKVKEAKGEVISIQEFMKSDVKGKKVRIIG